MWVQASMFPEFPTVAYAYEIDEFGSGGTYWEVYDDSQSMISWVESEKFPDFLDFMRSINYDVRINTYASWEAMLDE